jgi:hypothetical protein
MADYIERISLVIDGQDFDDVVNSLKEESATPTKTANTMNKRKRARGFKSGNDTFNLSCNCERIDPASGVPSWETLRKTRKKFSLVCEPSVGPSYAYGPCRVTNVSDSASDGDSSQDITIMALDKNTNPV